MLINPKHCALIFLLIGFINAGPTSRSLLKGDIKCAKKCTDSKNFNYQIGRSYRYNFETKNAFTPETGNVLNEVKITGHAKITIQSNCEHVLQLENVNVEGASKDQKEKLIKELEANNLAYSFQDGEINNICPLASESKNSHVLNIKKAILSALQFSPKQQLNELSTSNVDEKDINGNCETTYELQNSNADQYKIIKSKKLKSCSNRLNADSAILGTSSIAGEITNFFLNMYIENDHRCKISIKKSGIIESVKCTESSNSPSFIQNDLRNHHEISLKFSNEEPVHYPQLTGEYYEDSLMGEKIDLIDENANKVTSGQELKNAVQSICQSITNSTLSHQTANRFRDLVNAVRYSKSDLIKTELNNLLSKREMGNKNHNEVMATSTCCPHKLFKLYLEALISAKTDASLKLLVNDIVPNNFYLQEGSIRAEIKLISFYTSLAFYRHPNEETLRAALPLLKLKGRHTRNALFGITGLARTICKKEKNCNLPAITELANSIAENIPSNCAVKSSNENQVIESLKALENLQTLPEPVLKKMITCLSTASVSPNVKVSVIKNFDDKTNQDLVKKAIKDVLINSNEEDEVRIQAYKRYRSLITKENAKEIEKLVSSAKGELSSYIANDIQRLRDEKHVTCPMILAFLDATKDIDIKFSQQQGKSKTIVTHPLRLFFKSNLAVHTDVMYSPKTEKPLNVISSFWLRNKEILQIGLRSESGSNLLLNVANVEAVIDGVMQMIKNMNSKPEDGKSRLIDELAAKILPELANAFKDVDLFVKVGGRNLVYLNKNDQQLAVGSRLDKLKLGLAPILAMEQNSVFQVHSVSGIPTIVKKDKTILSNFVLFDTQKVNDNEVKFEITPNLVINQLVKVSYPIGRHQNSFVLENEQYLTTNFGLLGRKTDSNDKTQIRLKLSSKKVELLSHRVFNRIRQGSTVKEVASVRKNRDICLEQFLPIRKALGVSICSKNNDDEKSIVLEKTEDSNVLITLQKEKSGSSVNKKIIIEQENSPHKRRISVAVGQSEPGSTTLNFEIENPLGKGLAKVTTSKDKLNIQAKLDDHQVYSLDAVKSLDSKGKESNFKAKVSVSFPGLQKPFVTAFTAKIINDKKLHISGDLTVNEKNKLVSYEYNAEGQYSRLKRSADYSFKTDSDLKIFNLKGMTLGHSKHNAEYKSSGAKMSHLIEYPTSKVNPEKLEQIQMDYKFDFESGTVDKFNISSQLRSSQYPKLLNYKYEQIFVYKNEKELQHYENVIEMEFDFLGTGDDRKIRFNQVSKTNNMNKNAKKSSMDHLIRIVINKFNYNREITYNGNYEALGHNFYSINDKLKIQDISASTEVLSGSISLKSTDPSNTKFKFLVDYNCNKHGKFNWAEDITLDPKTKAVSTKIVLTVSRANQQSPTVYNGEYKSSENVLMPKSFDLKLRKASDNTDVLHIKHDSSNPNEKMTYVDYYGKRVYDFELKTSPKNKLVESLKMKVENVGELKLDTNSNANEGNKFTYKLKLHTQQPYQQNAVLVCGKKVLSLDFNVLRGDTKTLQVELYLSNPKKTLVTYRDVESGSILIKVYNTQVSFKHDNQPTGFSSMFELQKLEQKKKLVVMCDKSATKFSLMTKLEKDGTPVYTFDSTYSKTTSSVINFKSDQIILNININPFGSNEDDWKVLTIDFTRKDGKYKHSSKINIKKLSNKKALAIKSSSSGKRSDNDKSFEHDLDFQLSKDWSNLKFNAKLSEGDAVDQIDYHHDLNTQDMKGYGYKLSHHLKLTIKSELLFSHELNSKLDHNDNKYEFTSNSDVKAKCKYINGIKLNMKGNCDTKDKTGKFDLNLEHPYKNNVITANYNAKNSLKSKFSRELKVEVQNTKLNEKQLYLGKIDMIEGLELHLKYNKESSKGHQLENLELRVLSKPDEVSLVLVAPRGWSGHVKFLPPNNKLENMTFSLNLTKRGRVLLAVDSQFQLKQNGSRKRRAITINKKTEATIHTVIGFNGNPKFAEENIEINSDQLTYKFTSVYYNVDANLKGLSSEKKTFYLKGCSAKQVTNCAVFDANIERTGKGTKSTGTFKYGLDDEAINIKYDYNREKLDNGDYKGKISGEMNNKKFTGEILLKKNNELTLTFNLPERVIKFERELKSNGFKDTLWPNYVKDVKHAHALSYTITKSAEKRLHELKMDHPSFKRPLITSIEVVNKKSVAVVIDVVNDENKKININLYKDIEPKGKTVKLGFHFFRADRKIDFGFLQERIIVSDNDKSVKVVQKRSQHWVDRNGKNRTITRDQEAEVKFNSVEAVYDITTKDLLKSMKEYLSVDGRLHLDLKKRIANGVYDWAIDSLTKKKTEFDYKDNCLKVDSYDLPRDSYKNNHLINLCAMNKLSDSDLVKFEYIKPEYNARKKLVNSEKLIFKLSKAEEQQLRLLLKWDPEQIGEWIVEGGEYVERRQKEEQDALVFLQSELEDKLNLLRDQFTSELIEPMRKHRVESFKEILNEINPKLAAKLRTRRAAVVKKNDTEINLLNFSENLAKKLFNFKVIKFSPEEGIIELTFSSHPSFEGIKYGMKNSINYLFKE